MELSISDGFSGTPKFNMTQNGIQQEQVEASYSLL